MWRTVVVPMSSVVTMMLMSRSVRMNVSLAAVIVDADAIFGQAMRDRRVVGERKSRGRRENAKRINGGQCDSQFGAKAFDWCRQHRPR